VLAKALYLYIFKLKCSYSVYRSYIRVIYCLMTLNQPQNYLLCGPGSSVGIATDYGLDGPGSNSGGDETFLSCRPALRPTQPPVKWVPGLSRG